LCPVLTLRLKTWAGEFSYPNPTHFGVAVSTDGAGFATDAVINSIQLPTASGGTSTMFDLKAEDFLLSSGGTSGNAASTLLVATGQLPFVMADPTLSGLSTVLYPSTSAPTVFMKVFRLLTFSALPQRLLFGSWTPACPLRSKATRASHGPDEIKKYAFVVVLQIGQVVGEVGEVVANAGLQVLGNMTIDRNQRAPAPLTYIR
jgi:hypothetical protein